MSTETALSSETAWFSPAKINLFLHVLARRPDGYHELQTLFQLLDHGDVLHIHLRADRQLTLRCNRPELEMPDNLVLQAARSLQAATGISAGADIHLEKRLPSGAGLGGGSSNAATTLRALNSLWQTGLDTDALAHMGKSLGADVPVFVYGHTAWGEGIGEKLTPMTLPERWYVVLTPKIQVSTGEIFSHRELTRNESAIKMHGFLTGHSRNDCEALVRRLYPQVDAALKWLGQRAPPRMTGTGASVFAGFDHEAQAREVLEQLPDIDHGRLKDISGFVARGINRYP